MKRGAKRSVGSTRPTVAATRDELNAALQVAGQRLLEADWANKEASEAAQLAHKHWRRCHDDAETLLKALRDMAGEHGSQSVPVGPPEATWFGPRYRVYVHVSGHKGSLKKATAVQCRLCGEATAAVNANIARNRSL